MKVFAICVLLGIASGIKVQGDGDIWGDIVGDVDTSSYVKEEPKAYMEKEKPKINYALIQK